MKKIQNGISLILILITTLAAPLQAFGDQYDTVCGTAAQTAAANSNNGNSGQIAQYCADAKSQDKAASSENTMWKVYAAVSVVCTAACFTTFIPSGQTVCMGSGLAAAATDAIMTKNYMSAMTEAMTSASGLLFSSGSAAAGAAAPAASTGVIKDKGSCIAAAGAAFSAFSASQSAKSAQSTEATDLQYAQQLENSQSAGQQAPGQQLTSATSTGNSTSGNLGTGMFTAKNAPQGTTPQASDSCGADSSNTVSGAVQCAATANPNLASLVGSPGFGSAFQAASGMPLGQFLSGAKTPSQAIAQGLGGLAPNGVDTLQSALAQMEATPMYDTNGSTYAGGGGSAGGGKAGGDDLSSMVNGLMGQLGPKKKGETASGVTGAEFDAQRKLASISAEDRSVSLFARVALRYTVLSPNLVPPMVAAASLGTPGSAQNKNAPPKNALKEW